jgi:hypothetical protein
LTMRHDPRQDGFETPHPAPSPAQPSPSYPDAPPWTPPSPLASKRRRVDAVNARSLAAHPHHLSDAPALTVVGARAASSVSPLGRLLLTPPPGPVSSGQELPRRNELPWASSEPAVSTCTPRTQRSKDILEHDSQQLRLQMVEQEQQGKQTKKTYERHVKSYVRWWEQTQAEIAAGDPTRSALPALPITAAKVAAFLQHERQREKVGWVHIPLTVDPT